MKGKRTIIGMVLLASIAQSAFGQGAVHFPPWGTILEPANRAIVRFPHSIQISAQLVASVGTLTNVTFYCGANEVGRGESIGNDIYLVDWTPTAAGNYNIYAEMTDSEGFSGVSDSVWISVATSVPAYSVIEIRVSPEDGFFDPRAINDNGMIVGSISNSAAIWRNWRAEKFQVSGKSTVCRAIDDEGTVVGDYVYEETTYSRRTRPFIRLWDGTLREIPDIANGSAIAISHAGIVGRGTTNTDGGASYQTFLYDWNQSHFCEQACLDVIDINDNGLMVGNISNSCGGGCVFVQGPSFNQILNAGMLTGAAINDSGTIVGTGGTNAFMFQSGQLIKFGNLGGEQTRPLDVNNEGDSVGLYYPNQVANSSAAFIFHEGVMFDLNNLIPTNSDWQLQIARSINNAGWIVGKGFRRGDASGLGSGQKGFLLVPGPVLEITSATGTNLVGNAYLVPGINVLEESFDLKRWNPVFTNETDAVLSPFGITINRSEKQHFIRLERRATSVSD